MRQPCIQIKLRSLMIALALLCPVLIVLAPLLRSPEFRDLTLSMGWGNEDESQAIAAIRRMGGSVKRDETRSDRPVISVALAGVYVTNAGLVHLTSFDRLENLEVRGADVYDSGLDHLRGLKGFRSLTFSNTWITDTALEYLGQLTGLQTLDLSLNRGVTDRGLHHLEGLTNLGKLDLSDTSVTEVGIRKIQRALPSTQIIRQP
jgi:hypothetical protein